MEIRLENENDYLEVEELVRDSFWNVYRPGAFEHYIVHHLRDDESLIRSLAYVVEKDKKIIAHINYSTGVIDYEEEEIDAVVLGPVSVDKNHQNQGVGSKLISFTLSLAEDKKIPFVLVIGDENYYHRFGFESASDYGIFLEGTDTDDECPFFMVKIFDESVLRNELGIFHNPKVFDMDEKKVDEFDRKFEFKEKLVLDTQLKEL